MDGIHDMGGMHGFGKVEPEPNEPVFHAPWEGRTMALNRALGYTGIWTIDQTRYGIERLPPDVYLNSSYYKKWAVRLENLLIEKGLIGADELKAGHALRPGKQLKRNARRRRRAEYAVARFVYASGAGPRPLQTRRPRAHQKYPSGNPHPAAALRARPCRRDRSHPRLPRVSGHCRASGKGDDPQWLYTVLFDGRELWGQDSDPTLKVSIEAFEPYLDPA